MTSYEKFCINKKLTLFFLLYIVISSFLDKSNTNKALLPGINRVKRTNIDTKYLTCKEGYQEAIS